MAIEWPIVVAGAGLWSLGDEDSPVSPIGEFEGWVWPMESWHGYDSVVSQAYRAPDHHGVDIMFRRKVGGNDQMYARGTSQGSANHFCPDGINVLAPRDGYLWSSGEGPTGKYIVIDTGKPIAIFMVHMRELFVPMDVSKGSGRHPIKAGQPIGTAGYSPRDAAKLNHLHLEVWRNGGASQHVDPAPYLSGAIRR